MADGNIRWMKFADHHYLMGWRGALRFKYTPFLYTVNTMFSPIVLFS